MFKWLRASLPSGTPTLCLPGELQPESLPDGMLISESPQQALFLLHEYLTTAWEQDHDDDEQLICHLRMTLVSRPPENARTTLLILSAMVQSFLCCARRS